MTIRWSKTYTLITIISFLAFAGLFAFAYFQYIVPLQRDVDVASDALSAEQEATKTLNNQTSVSTSSETILKSAVELQKVVPVKPFTEQFMLELEKAEVISNSVILGISFTDDGDVAVGEANTTTTPLGTTVTDNSTNNPTTNSNDSTTNSNNATTNNQTTDSGSSTQANTTQQNQPPQQKPVVLPVPPGMKTVTASLSVEAKTYEDLLTFIKTIEHEQRAAQVTSIAITGAQEVLKLEDKVDPLKYQLGVTVFYYPALVDLQKDLPTIDPPPPAEKEDPLHELTN